MVKNKNSISDLSQSGNDSGGKKDSSQSTSGGSDSGGGIAMHYGCYSQMLMHRVMQQ